MLTTFSSAVVYARTIDLQHGVQVSIADGYNLLLRHCRIGKITLKANADNGLRR